MRHESLSQEWYARERASPIGSAMRFAPEGLVLGAGTLLLQTDAARRLQSVRGQEARLLALLSAFCGKPVAPSAVRSIERAARAWRQGDDCLAYISLAHAALPTPQDLRSGAYRLEMAECAMRCGRIAERGV